MRPLISFIMPIYNGEHHILNSTYDLLQSTFTDYELVMIDNASTDRSGEICDILAASHPCITVHHESVNVGPGMARNRGVELANGEFLFFWDCDDKIDASQLKRIAEVLRSNPDIDILTMNHKEMTPSGNNTVQIIDVEEKIGIDELLYKKNAVLHTGVWRSFFKREFLINKEIKFFKMAANEDLCFNSLAFLHAKTVYTLRQAFYIYYRHYTSNSVVSSSKFQQLASGLEFCADQLKLYSQTHVLSEAKKQAIDGFIYASTMLLIEKITLDELVEGEKQGLVIGEAEESAICLSLYEKYGMIGCVKAFWQTIWSNTHSYSLDANKKIYVCPAGSITNSIVQKLLLLSVRISGVLDNNMSSRNFHIQDTINQSKIEMYSFDILHTFDKKDVFILVLGSVNTAQAICKQLTNMGFIFGEHYITGTRVSNS